MKEVIWVCTLLLILAQTHLFANEDALSANSDTTIITVCQPDKEDNSAVFKSSISDQLAGFFNGLFNTSQWPARWACGTWTPFHGWLYISSDIGIWLAYFMIPLVLAYFLIKRKHVVPYRSIFILFIAFILACGLTHLIDAIIFWWPAYKLSAVIRFGTMLASWGTVIALIKVIPEALTLPGHQDLLREINQRKRIEDKLAHKVVELEAINKELESFSYSVSHDLRAPLRTINGFTNALVEDYGEQLDEQAKDYLRRVETASIRMGNLIDDLLDLSRISRKNIVKENIDISKIAQDVSAFLNNQAEQKVDVKVKPGMTAKGDMGLIRVLFENLVGNSFKYSSRTRKPKIEIGEITHPKEGKVFFIRDNGVGFNMEYADKIFGAFQRLHSNREFEGTGIGLATVIRIINRHNGIIWAESEVEKGSTFYFRLTPISYLHED